MANNQTLVQRVPLVIQYQGTYFCGWQRQPNQRTVQEEIENTIASVINEPVTLHGAGRTDAGVHAAAQVAHFDVEKGKELARSGQEKLFNYIENFNKPIILSTGLTDLKTIEKTKKKIFHIWNKNKSHCYENDSH